MQVIGVLMHGYELFLYIVPDDNVQVGSSVTIQCLQRYIYDKRTGAGPELACMHRGFTSYGMGFCRVAWPLWLGVVG